MNKINGWLMSKDIVIANIVDNEVQILNDALIPIYFQKHTTIENWLEMRAIDSYRGNSRLLKDALNVDFYDDVAAAMKFNAATITDSYWIKLHDDNLCWNDVKFIENNYAELALTGNLEDGDILSGRTPELTNIGSFEKCWKIDKYGNWWLYKTGNIYENFSEIFVNKVGLKLNFDMAYYKLEDSFVKSKDFTKNGEINLELMRVLVDDDDEYNCNFKLLYSIDKSLSVDYIKMIYLDTICYNTDRHTENYGLLRDSNTGKILKLAPNFDNNLALISKNAKTYSDGFINYFINFINSNLKANEIFQQIKPYKLTEKDLDNIISDINLNLSDDKISHVKNIVLGSQNIIFSKLVHL